MSRAAAALRERGIDVLLLTPGADLFYLTGFTHGHAGERLLALVLREDGLASWIAPLMNVEQVRAHAPPEQAVRGWGDAEGYVPPLREALVGARAIAFDDEARAAFVLDVTGEVARGARVTRGSSVMHGLRVRKDAAELEALRTAGRVVDETIATAMSLCRPCKTEAEVDRELRAALRKRAPDQSVAFTIVASGPNGALPHHETSSRTIESGDVVILDFGTRERRGYHSDITVTCCVGEPRDAEAREVYRTVWRAQQAAIEAVRPGVMCESVDRAARSVIASAGYGPNFLHRTGHGLGLQVHEPPFLVGGNAEVLEEGMVFSIEPGIYLPGRFGVRLEVIASVTADGVSLINAPSAPELPIV
jgi:Xaa-Pro dipeptidase